MNTDGDTMTGPLVVADSVRSATSEYRRYYHLALAAFDPGASGATWTDPAGPVGKIICR